MKNYYTGIFVVFDGPNGVGKTTIIENVAKQLKNLGYEIETTKEPSKSKLGCFLLEIAEQLSGDALACLVAANRYEHISNEIVPALEKGKVVLCDRYILSSYILQGMDGVDFKFIDDINSHIILPDIQIVLKASPNEIQNRLGQREALTRFEKNNQTDNEIKYLNRGIEYLKKDNIETCEFNTENDRDENVNAICDVIVSHINRAGD